MFHNEIWKAIPFLFFFWNSAIFIFKSTFARMLLLLYYEVEDGKTTNKGGLILFKPPANLDLEGLAQTWSDTPHSDSTQTKELTGICSPLPGLDPHRAFLSHGIIIP